MSFYSLGHCFGCLSVWCESSEKNASKGDIIFFFLIQEWPRDVGRSRPDWLADYPGNTLVFLTTQIASHLFWNKEDYFCLIALCCVFSVSGEWTLHLPKKEKKAVDHIIALAPGRKCYGHLQRLI